LIRPAVSVKRDSTKEELIETVKNNLILYDNVTATEKITANIDVSKVDITKRGSYHAYIAATDEAGNTSEPFGVPVRIYAPDEIVATVNGQTGFPGGMVYIEDTKVELELFNLPAGEPYFVKIKGGTIFLAGAMAPSG